MGERVSHMPESLEADAGNLMRSGERLNAGGTLAFEEDQ